MLQIGGETASSELSQRGYTNKKMYINAPRTFRYLYIVIFYLPVFYVYEHLLAAM